MSKSNRKIRRVELDGRQYYGYELDKAVYGVRERLYAETEEELQQKIQQADDERFRSLADGLPSKPTLKNYAELYFRYSFCHGISIFVIFPQILCCFFVKNCY